MHSTHTFTKGLICSKKLNHRCALLESRFVLYHVRTALLNCKEISITQFLLARGTLCIICGRKKRDGRKASTCAGKG